MLLLAAIIWGVSFVTQKLGGDYLGPFTFNSFRFFIGAAGVAIALIILDRVGITHKPKNKEERMTLIKAGVLCGLFLTLATNLQQIGLTFEISSGKAGFITALYIVIVPIIGMFFKQKCPWNVWVAVAISVVGLYFMCCTESLSLKVVDILFIGSAFAYAFQITCIGRFGSRVDGLRLSCIEFIVAGAITFIPALIREIIPYEGGMSAWAAQFADRNVWIVLLYMGLLCCSVAYSLQIIGMRGLNPTVASLLMSFESAFALVAGVIFLDQEISLREGIGCLVTFAAICLAQFDFKKKKNV